MCCVVGDFICQETELRFQEMKNKLILLNSEYPTEQCSNLIQHFSDKISLLKYIEGNKIKFKICGTFISYIVESDIYSINLRIIFEHSKNLLYNYMVFLD